MTEPVDFATRQQAEGFARLISEPNQPNWYNRPGPDFRGPGAAARTHDWYRPAVPGEPDLVWETAPVPSAVETTFSFIGDSANLPENIYPGNQATLYAGDELAVTFDLGLRGPAQWTNGDWALEFSPRMVTATVDGYDRNFNARGCCGVYRLAAPARMLAAREPLHLRVVVEPWRSDVITWFAIHQRSDVLALDARTAGEQIEQLQHEIIHLKRTIGALARRSYPELYPERIPTEDVILYTRGRRHVHPPDVTRLQNGDLLSAFRESTEHLSTDRQIVMVRSRDGGQTWGERQVLREHPETDERECSLMQLRDGTLLAAEWPNTYYDAAGYYYAHPVTNRAIAMGMYVGRSTDNGRTWEWPAQPVDPAPFHLAVTSEHIVELPAGRLLMASYYIPAPGVRHYGCAIFCSDDKGQRWRYLATVADIPGVRLSEPALERTASGRLICLMRNESGPEYYQSNSGDGGETWTPARPTGIPGHIVPCSLVTLRDGTVLCVYGSREDPCGLYAVASYDDGESWHMAGRRVIRDDFQNTDCGYPSTLLMPDGRVFTVYYFNMFGRFFIGGSFFRWEKQG